MRYAGTLQRLAEDDCNIATDDAGLAKRNQKRNRIEDRVCQLCKDITLAPLREGESLLCSAHEAMNCSLCTKFGLVIDPKQCLPVFSGDPRGAVLKIRVPDGYTNDFGGEGICVPS